jgi:hypothetical protein
MAKLLGADGAIMTKVSPSGSNHVDVMLTLQALERKGVSTVLITPEKSGRDGTEVPLLFHVPEAISLICTDSEDSQVKIGVPRKVVGAGDAQIIKGFSSERICDRQGEIAGGLDWLGGMCATYKEY